MADAGARAVDDLDSLACQARYHIPAESMAPTLIPGDCIVAWKGYYDNHAPAYGDVAVFRVPSDPGTDYIKRIVGLPGDRIRMTDGRLVINGKMVPRRRVGDEFRADLRPGQQLRFTRFTETMPNGREHFVYEMTDHGPYDDTSEFIVPPGHVFVLGDNRDDSSDSRVNGAVGFVPIANLEAFATHIYHSRDPERIGTQVQPIP